MRRLQHGLDDGGRAGMETIALCSPPEEQVHMGLTFRIGQRTAKGLGPKIVHERLGTGAITWTTGLAGEEPALVTVSKCVAPQAFRDLPI